MCDRALALGTKSDRRSSSAFIESESPGRRSGGGEHDRVGDRAGGAVVKLLVTWATLAATENAEELMWRRLVGLLVGSRQYGELTS